MPWKAQPELDVTVLIRPAIIRIIAGIAGSDALAEIAYLVRLAAVLRFTASNKVPAVAVTLIELAYLVIAAALAAAYIVGQTACSPVAHFSLGAALPLAKRVRTCNAFPLVAEFIIIAAAVCAHIRPAAAAVLSADVIGTAALPVAYFVPAGIDARSCIANLVFLAADSAAGDPSRWALDVSRAYAFLAHQPFFTVARFTARPALLYFRACLPAPAGRHRASHDQK